MKWHPGAATDSGGASEAVAGNGLPGRGYRSNPTPHCPPAEASRCGAVCS
jgi:hypothetical protein